MTFHRCSIPRRPIALARPDAGEEDRMVVTTRTFSAWERYAWAAGILFVVAHRIVARAPALLAGSPDDNLRLGLFHSVHLLDTAEARRESFTL
jgi:hypothetical protein